MVVKIVPNDKANPPGKLADAELHFTDGVLDGLKLIGFAVWERRSGSGRNVTFPARQYSVNGERRSFALLRPIADAASQERVRDLVLQAYAEYEEDSGRGRFVERHGPGRRHRGGVRWLPTRCRGEGESCGEPSDHKAREANMSVAILERG